MGYACKTCVRACVCVCVRVCVSLCTRPSVVYLMLEELGQSEVGGDVVRFRLQGLSVPVLRLLQVVHLHVQLP